MHLPPEVRGSAEGMMVLGAAPLEFAVKKRLEVPERM